MVSSTISRFLLLGSLLTILVAASVRRPSAASSHTAAFVHPKITARGGFHQSTTADATKRAARNYHKVRGESPRNGGVKLHAAAKSAASKKKSTKKTSANSDVESFKKSEFIASVAEKTGFTRAESEDALQAVLDTLTEQMILDKKITLVGFGTFQAKQRAARKGRNPRTGEELDIPASKLPSFTAAKSLKNKVNGKEE